MHTGQVLGAHGWHYRGLYARAELLGSLWEEATERPANQIELSPTVVRHLTRRFKRQIGVTPGAYVRAIRARADSRHTS